MTHPFLIYGANGYTGALIARTAVTQGLQPILAGRNEAQVAALAGQLRLPYRIAALEDASALDAMLSGVTVVLHCAGPFVYTAAPMAEACLRNGVHYLDVTGELVVFEALAQRNDEAQRVGVMLLPGVGFDVAPSDCLAVHLHRRLPTAVRLLLGVCALGKVSRGTATTMLEALLRGEGGMVRRDGKLTPVPLAWKTRQIDFGKGPRLAATVAWGDVATAYHSTGVPNIEVYMCFPKVIVRALQVGRYFGWLLRAPGVAKWLRRRIRSAAPGPTDEERMRGVSLIWGRAEDDLGHVVEARMRTPEAYILTALASLRIVQKVLAGDVKPGFQTPAGAYGADWILEIEGVERVDLG
ncbi:MAG: saccharopine dehydrogenase NADP-binding domain-containing protein [Caldilinea sp.]|nr:saccharopine dehydrogenase NADP-binding domain-containing protein [Caldilinea sp.]MDW8439752.1 saccharopine dehydrogenase NADP-binding domain-containing protein [Caldilineaceae bacterium]